MTRFTEAPYFVWRRVDGYVGCTRYDPQPSSDFEVLLKTDTWSEARALIEKERVTS